MSTASADSIISYREKMKGAREEFMSAKLAELQKLLSDNPWDESVRQELVKFIEGPLRNDIQKYNEQALQTWETMFGKLVKHFAKAAPWSVGMGASSAGLSAHLMPNASAWALAVGLAGPVLKHLPAAVNEVWDDAISKRRSKRTAIAYLAEFNK